MKNVLTLKVVSSINTAWAKGPVYAVLRDGVQIACGQEKYIRSQYPSLFLTLATR